MYLIFRLLEVIMVNFIKDEIVKLIKTSYPI